MFQNAIQGKLQAANDWLQDPAALVGSAGQCQLCSIIGLAFSKAGVINLAGLTALIQS